MSHSFFSNLKSFSNLEELNQDRHFERLPDDWCVVVTDVVSSSEAIGQGRYKDVNTMGAAAITIVRNLLKPVEIPFLFGGDGATLLIPEEFREKVIPPLSALIALSEETFSIGLRVGIMDMNVIAGEGLSIEVARMEIGPGNSIAVLRGGGAGFAEKLIKTEAGTKYRLPADNSTSVDLTGLSCRWQGIPNKRGRILSIIVEAKANCSDEIYNEIVRKLNGILSESLADSNPVNPDLMTYRTFREIVASEKRLHKKFNLGWLFRYIEILAAVLIFRWKLHPLFFSPNHYQSSMRTHSDFVKFSDRLQMVVDCSPHHEQLILEYLETERNLGKLCYGVHQSEESLMTCFVDDISDGHHIHFIDGGDGGYAMAAKQLKEQQSI